jgi:endonuclease III
MNKSKEYSRKVRKLYRELKRNYPKAEKKYYEEPAEAIVYGIISENMTESTAQDVSRKFTEYFVDLNDLRVSRPEEIAEVIDQDTAAARQIATTLTNILRAIFNEHHAVNLQSLKKIGKRPAKKALEKLDCITYFTVNYCMLTALQGHSIPLTKKMVEYLKNNELVDPEADEQKIEGFLTRQIAAKDGYEFYNLLRRESETLKVAKKKRTTRITKTRKKTKRKK